jgi:hypothetical protein
MCTDREIRVVVQENGEPSARLVELADGRRALVPARLFIEVAPPSASGSDSEGRGSGRHIVIDAETTDSGGVNVLAVTVFRPDGALVRDDLSEGLGIWDYAREGVRQATTVLDGSVIGGDASATTAWRFTGIVGRDLATGIRSRTGPGRGRRKPVGAVAVAARMYAEGFDFSQIRRVLAAEHGIDRSQRTIRRWIDEIRNEDLKQ